MKCDYAKINEKFEDITQSKRGTGQLDKKKEDA